MVAPSKIFSSPLTYHHCSQSILHPGRGCTRYFLDNLFDHTLAGLKYFTPLLITPLVMKNKSMNRELFINIVKYYLQTVSCASLAISSVFLLVCCMRNYLGSFRFYTTLIVPTSIGMQFCWLFPKRILKLFTTATSQSAIELILKQNPNKFSHSILYSSMVQTILFMLNSAIILHYKRKNIYKDFWFIQPYETLKGTGDKSQKQEEADETCVNDETCGMEESYEEFRIKRNEELLSKCDHKNLSCQKFILNGMKSYLIYGIPLDILSTLMRGKMPHGNRGLLRQIMEKLKTFRPNMTGFFISYVGLYRLSHCLMHKYYPHLALDVQHMLSAFLGGLSYMCVKRVNFVTLSLVMSIQLLWQQFCDSIKTPKTGRKPNVVLLFMKHAPMSQILLPLNCAYLVHTAILDYNSINSLAKGFLDGLTCNKTKDIHHMLVNSDLQTLINQAKLKPIKTFL